MSKTYVLETEWTWDGTHRELCSFTVEDWELELNDPAKIFDPLKPMEVLNGWLRRFKLIAEAQNGGPICVCKLVHLWRAEKEAWSTRVHQEVTYSLTLVGEFNQDGTPKLQLGKEVSQQQ